MRARRSAERATNREMAVVAAVLEAGSEKEAAHRLGLSHSTVKHHLANARSKGGGDDHSAARVDPRRAAAEPDGEAVLSRAIDSMGAEREDGIP